MAGDIYFRGIAPEIRIGAGTADDPRIRRTSNYKFSIYRPDNVIHDEIGIGDGQFHVKDGVNDNFSQFNADAIWQLTRGAEITTPYHRH
jgi:hypothetical protein